ELPEEHVSQNEGDTVRLSVGADELAANPKLARPYNPREFQPVPPGEPAGHDRASRVALQTGQPVVASVGDNAADVVAPESPDAPPSGNGSVAANVAGPQPPCYDDSSPQKMTGGAPDVTAGGPALSDPQEAAPAHEGTPPPQTPSATASTTGELIGGKPSTGGMGSASVAPVQSYLQDAAPAPTASTDEGDHAADRGTVEPLPASGDRPEYSSPGAPSAHMPADEGLRSNQVASPASQGTPVTSPLAPAPPLQMQVPSWASSGVLATGISISTGALAGVMMRRRQLRAERAAKSAQRTLTERVQAADEQTSGASAQAGPAATQARSAKRAAKSGRWFRRGVLLGAALGILFAPQPGAQLRERLRESARQRFTRGA
ncbi:MAG TPA: hypothetical protein VE258_09065, partial [Ktedonobacterales bacterium]|nr:hypothetical protein [Ktedonobacterales bacterium]